MLLFCNLFGLAQSLVFVLQPILLSNTNMAVSSLNQTIAIGSALMLVCMPAWLKIKRKLGAVTTLLFALSLFALSHLLIGALIWKDVSLSIRIYAPSIFLASKILYGSGASAIVPIIQAWASETVASNSRLRILEKISGHLILGRIAGLVIALPLVWIWPPLTILLILVLSTIVGTSLWRLRREDRHQKEETPFQEKQPIKLRQFISVLRPHLLLAASLQVLIGIVQFTFSIWLMDTLKWRAENVAIFSGGLLILCGALVVFAQLYLTSFIRNYPFVLHLANALLIVIGFALCIAPNIFLFSVLNALIIVASALWAPVVLDAAIKRTEHLKNDSVSTAIAMVHKVSYSTVGMVSGYLYQWNVKSIFYLAAMMAMVAFFVGRRILARTNLLVNN